jgi:hypothetical protein
VVTPAVGLPDSHQGAVASEHEFERAVRAPLTGRAPATPVLVNLDALFPIAQSARRPRTRCQSSAADDDRLHLRGWAVGTLHRWLRSSTGDDWIGVCTIVISRGDGSTYRAVDQLVPAQALRPRTT